MEAAEPLLQEALPEAPLTELFVIRSVAFLLTGGPDPFCRSKSSTCIEEGRLLEPRCRADLEDAPLEGAMTGGISAPGADCKASAAAAVFASAAAAAALAAAIWAAEGVPPGWLLSRVLEVTKEARWSLRGRRGAVRPSPRYCP